MMMQARATGVENWRPGFARRAENFTDICALASKWRWSGETVASVTAAILKGALDLNAGQRLTLMLYVDHLNERRLEDNDACVYPSATLIAQYLGCSLRIARAHRKALETAGYMVRDFNRANRPAGKEAFDLAPLMARLAELRSCEQSSRDLVAERRAAYLDPIVHLHDIAAHPDQISPLEQSYKNLGCTVTGPDALAARCENQPHQAAPAANGDEGGSSNQAQSQRIRKRGSSGGASFNGDSRSEPKVRAEMARDEALAALEASPRLARVLPQHLVKNPLDTRSSDIDAIAEAAQALLPHPQRNNGETARWGWRRHGPRVIAMLAIAIEDAGVRDPCAYFGKLASSERSATLDLRLNLRRIIQGQAMAAAALDIAKPPEPAALMEAPGANDPIWRLIDAKLRQIIPTGAYGSWFSRLGFAGIEDGTLTLLTRGQTSAERLKALYLGAIAQAAEAAGHPIKGVMISVRPQEIVDER